MQKCAYKGLWSEYRDEFDKYARRVADGELKLPPPNVSPDIGYYYSEWASRLSDSEIITRFVDRRGAPDGDFVYGLVFCLKSARPQLALRVARSHLDPSWRLGVQQAALRQFVTLAGPEVREVCLKFLRDADPSVRNIVPNVVAEIKDLETCVEIARECLSNKDNEVCLQLLYRMNPRLNFSPQNGNLSDARIWREVIKLIQSSDVSIRRRAIWAAKDKLKFKLSWTPDDAGENYNAGLPVTEAELQELETIRVKAREWLKSH